MGFGEALNYDQWEEPTKKDYEQVNKHEDLVNTLIASQFDLRPVEATAQYVQIREIVRWYLAFNIDGWETRRRRRIQHHVANVYDIEYTAVQDKVRDLYDGKAGKKSAQELFEEDLKAIEEAYESHLDAR